jgi:hypothetical protein
MRIPDTSVLFIAYTAASAKWRLRAEWLLRSRVHEVSVILNIAIINGLVLLIVADNTPCGHPSCSHGKVLGEGLEPRQLSIVIDSLVLSFTAFMQASREPLGRL